MNHKDVKKIDVHAHATPNQNLIPKNFTGYSMVNEQELLEFYDKLNIEKGVLLPITSPEYHWFMLSTQEMKQMADKNPDRFLWFCNMDPRMFGNDPQADLSKPLQFYKELGAKGLGELTANMLIDDPLMENLFYHCGECDMPVTIHIAPANAPYGFYGIKDDLGLPRLEKVLKKYPKLKIFGHSQLFWAEMSADVTEESRLGYPTGKVTEGRIAQLLREYPNLYCDVSASSGMNAFSRDKEYAAKFIEEFSDRIMYGCDICATYNKHSFIFEDWLDEMMAEGMISLENYYKFVRGNAEKLLKLEK